MRCVSILLSLVVLSTVALGQGTQSQSATGGNVGQTDAGGAAPVGSEEAKAPLPPPPSPPDVSGTSEGGGGAQAAKKAGAATVVPSSCGCAPVRVRTYRPAYVVSYPTRYYRTYYGYPRSFGRSAIRFSGFFRIR